jgi:hypothetical protein
MYWNDSPSVQICLDMVQWLYIFAIVMMSLIAMYELFMWMVAPIRWTYKGVRGAWMLLVPSYRKEDEKK